MQLPQRSLNLISRNAFLILVIPTTLNILFNSSIALAQTPADSSSREPLLNVQGTLEPGDKLFSDEDERLYDEYLFVGSDRQRIIATLESSEFDPQLLIVDAAGEKVVENDDINEENSNAFITVTLPRNEGYRALVRASNAEEIGRYTLTVIPGEHDFLSPLLELLGMGKEIADTSEQLLGRHSPIVPNVLLSIFSSVIFGTGSVTPYEYEDVGLEAVSFLRQAHHLSSLYNDLPSQYDDPHLHRSITTDQIQDFLSELYVFLEAGITISHSINQRVDQRDTPEGLVWLLGDPVPEASKQLNSLLTLYFEVLRVFGNPQEWGFETNLSKYVEEYSELVRLYSGDSEDFEISIGNLTPGLALEQIGDYFGALSVYQRELASSRDEAQRDRIKEVESLLRIGSLYNKLGLYPSAVDFLNQALEILKAVSPSEQVDAIAQKYYEQRGELSEQKYPNIDIRIIQLAKEGARLRQLDLEAAILINLGSTYNNLRQESQSLASYEQALSIYQDTRNPAGEASAFNGIGSIYSKLSQQTDALEQYYLALKLRRQIGNQVGESETLSHVGNILAEQGQPELAIIFYKQSINITELIRQDIQNLPQYQQESYTRLITDTYRNLADLLLQQNRVLEAQQVLDLLKVQELDDYLRNVRGNEQTAQGLDFWQPEQQILQLYDQFPNFGAFLSDPEVITLIEQLRRTAQGQSLNPQILVGLQDNLRTSQNAALLYPLVLEDRLELILVTPNGEPIQRTVAVQREDLNRAIVEFRAFLRMPSNDGTSTAQQLYQWLIQPIAADLEQAGTETIIYAADGQLRYIPLAALHDGNQWLIQRFAINYITAASLTDFTQSSESRLQVLAAAFSDTEKEYEFSVGDRTFSFTGLEYAGIEVENIATEIPATASLFDEQFSLATVEPHLDDYNIVHFATHAAFVPGLPEESFILFGDGDRVTLRDIADWSLPNVDLVVLSACETAVGGELGNGEEILGFGYQIQEARARAAIASLWTVNDGGTQVLMNAFYAALKQDGITKVEALRQAQIALITGNLTESELDISLEESQYLNFPYYWAAFILIGNGL